MIFLDKEGLKHLKKMCMRKCIGMMLVGTITYTILRTMVDQEERIDNLTKKVEELKSKGE